MNILPRQLNSFKNSVALGLALFKRPIPMTASEWADENFYLSAESSYVEGRWVTLPFQIAILNSMGNDEIREINLVKSARIGYSQMLKAAMAYMLEHKKRNQLLFQPTDAAASSFMKAHIESMIRDVPCIKNLAPWYGKKHRDNTLDTKRFANKRQLWCVGGTAAKNYRERSVDTVIYDELAAFVEDVEGEGSPTFLGDKRIEGSVFPKSIRGSTPKIKGQCQIERAADEAYAHLYFYLPCPHCQELQRLKWGGAESEFGLKWVDENPKTAAYLCEHCSALIENNQLLGMQEHALAEWRCEKTGLRTKDGLRFYNNEGLTQETPESVAWYIWSAYSPFSPWSRLVTDFLKAKNDTGKLKTFVNTSLGETWDDDVGDKVDWQILYGRREVYQHEVPDEVVYITGGIDQQDDRVEFSVFGWGKNEECWLLWTYALYGDQSSDEIKRKSTKLLNKEFKRSDGTSVNVNRWCWDSGGHYTDEVYQASKKNGLHRVIPIKGANVYGKPIANFPKKRNAKGVYLTEVGTDNAKELIYSRLVIQQSKPNEATAGYVHFPMNDDICSESFFQQLTAERKKLEFKKGRRVYRWDAGGRRNEALDMFVYALAALRISQQKFAIDLNKLSYIPEIKKQQKQQVTEQNKKTENNWLQSDHKGSWI